MYRGKRVTVYMPCRNEAKNLPRVLKSIPPFVDEVLVIDNNSTDDTVKIAKKHGAKVLTEARTKRGIGYGFAHMKGIKAATGDIIVACDSDGQHPLKELSAMIDLLLDKNIDFISCSRYHKKHIAKIPLKLRVGVSALNLEVLLLYGVRIQDILSGMWVFKKSARPKLHLSEGDWNLSPQIKISAATHEDVNFTEYPIEQKQRGGTSHQNYVSSGLRHAWWIAKSRVHKRKRTRKV